MDFYGRRVRRIFPALIFLLFGVSILGLLFLSSVDLRNLGRQIIWGSFFSENFYLIKNTGGYWDTATEMKPLMHLWTLAVEEQYYIFYPFICWFIFKQKFSLFNWLCLFWLFSFGLNVFFIESHNITTFYSLPTRFWELCSGGLLASIGLRNLSLNNSLLVNPHNRLIKSEFFSIAGIIVLILGLLFSNHGNDFPGWRALFPVIATCLLIAGKGSKINRLILGSKPLVFIGLISYTLYLWHWPFLAIARTLNNGNLPSLSICILLLVLGFAFSLISFYFIELPIRTKAISKRLICRLCICLLIPVCIGLIFSKSGGLPRRTSDFNVEAQIKNSLPDTNELCQTTYGYKGAFCWASASNPSIAIVGDSHAYHLGSGFRKHGKDFLILGQHGTAPFFDLVKQDQESDWKRGSPSNMDRALNIILKDKNIHLVILSARWSFVLSDPNLRRAKDGRKILDRVSLFETELEKVTKKLLASGKKVVILKDSPEFPFGPRTCLKVAPISLPKQKICGLPRSKVFQNASQADKILEKIANKFKGKVKLIDLKEMLCDNDYCLEIQDGKPYYKDGDHLSDLGSEKVVTGILKQINDSN